MITKNGLKPGRKSNRIYDVNKKLVEGLSREKRTGYYYATGTNPRKRFGKQLIPAIQLFRMWQAQQEGQVLTINEPKPRVELTRNQSPAGRPGLSHPVVTIRTQSRITKEAFLQELVRWMADPALRRLATEVTGYEFDRLEALPPPQKSISLTAALKNYEGKLKKPSIEEQKQVRWAWDAFRKAMGVGTLKEITKEKVGDWVGDLLKRYSRKMAKNRLARVRAVLRYNEKHEHDILNCQRLLRYIAALELPEQELPDPKPISVADFQKLLNAAQSWAKEDDHFSYWPPMLLIALNCCYYAIDLIRLPVAAVDLAKGTICFDRGKTNTPRVAVLWPRTVEALKPILAGREKRKLVFETYRRGGWSKSGFIKAFNKLRQRAGFHFFPIDAGEDEADRSKRKKLVAPKGLPLLEFNQIRDGAYTAAIEGGAEPMHAQILAGHRTGIKDSYVKRNPKMVADACASIEKHYFPDQK